MTKTSRSDILRKIYSVYQEKRDLTYALIRWTLIDSQYEREVRKFIMKKKGELAVDVGANLGFYTVLLSSRFKRVIALEPNPAALQILTLYVSYKEFANVTVLPVAVADTVGVAELTIREINPFGSPSIIAFHGSGRVIEVKQTTLDKLLEGESHIDLIKMDIEGAEFLALQGAKATLRKVETLIVELHDDKRRKELEDFLGAFGFEWKWLRSGHIVARKLQST